LFEVIVFTTVSRIFTPQFKEFRPNLSTYAVIFMMSPPYLREGQVGFSPCKSGLLVSDKFILGVPLRPSCCAKDSGRAFASRSVLLPSRIAPLALVS